MKVRNSLVLAHMLLRFFTRRALSVGLLRSPWVKGLAAAAVLLVLATCAVAAYYFLKPVASDEAAWGLLFGMSTISMVLYVQVAFLIVKTLFLTAGGLLELSFQLPLTNRERSAALLMCESTMAAVLAGAGCASLSVASLFVLGPAAVPRLLESIVLPIVLTYLALSLLYVLLCRVATLLRLQRIQNLIAIVTLFALLLTYASALSSLTSEATLAYFSPGAERGTWVGMLAWISGQHGFAAMLAFAVVLAVLLAGATLCLTPNEHVRHARYLWIPVGRVGRAVLGPYDLCLLRSAQTWVCALVAAAVVAGLCVRPLMNPLWGLTVLAMSGLYQFARTEPLRVMVGAQRGAWVVYGRLVKAQALLLVAFSVPALVAVRLFGEPEPVAAGAVPLAGCAAGMLLALCVGILFPAENDNPFSVFLGLSLTVVLIGLAGIALGILQLPGEVVVGCVVGALAMFVWYGVQGIRSAESRRRHEEVTHPGEQSRWSGIADSGGVRRHPVVPHVLDG